MARKAKSSGSPAKPASKPRSSPSGSPSRVSSASQPRRSSPSVKPFKQLSPATQARVRAYAKKHGLTVRQASAAKHRQAVRGHKPGEAARRREREKAEASGLGKLTTKQRSEVRKFYEANMAPREAKPGVSPSTVGAVAIAESREKFVAQVTMKGFTYFRDLRDMRQRTQAGDYGYDMAAWEDYLDTEWDLDEWHVWYQ